MEQQRELGYTISVKNPQTDKFENYIGQNGKQVKLFADGDGVYGNKGLGFVLDLSGKFPVFTVKGQKYGATFANESEKSGTWYKVANQEEGDFFIFKEKPYTGPKTGKSVQGAAKSSASGYNKSYKR